jgi:hypothetical protein
MKAGHRRGKERLSNVYLDDYPVTLMGDEAQPPLWRIGRAGGKDPGRVDVVYLTSPRDRIGRVVQPSEIVDRTAEPARPIYLRSVPKVDTKAIETVFAPGTLAPADPAGLGATSPTAGPGATSPTAGPGDGPAMDPAAGPGSDHEPGSFRSPSQTQDDRRPPP